MAHLILEISFSSATTSIPRDPSACSPGFCSIASANGRDLVLEPRNLLAVEHPHGSHLPDFSACETLVLAERMGGGRFAEVRKGWIATLGEVAVKIAKSEDDFDHLHREAKFYLGPLKLHQGVLVPICRGFFVHSTRRLCVLLLEVCRRIPNSGN